MFYPIEGVKHSTGLAREHRAKEAGTISLSVHFREKGVIIGINKYFLLHCAFFTKMSKRQFVSKRQSSCREMYCTQQRLCMQCHLFQKVELLDRKVKALEEQAKEYDQSEIALRDVIRHNEQIISLQKEALSQVEKFLLTMNKRDYHN